MNKIQPKEWVEVQLTSVGFNGLVFTSPIFLGQVINYDGMYYMILGPSMKNCGFALISKPKISKYDLNPLGLHSHLLNQQFRFYLVKEKEIIRSTPPPYQI